MDALLQDLRYAVRTLLRTPGFAAAAVLTLALGIGGTTAIFSSVRAVLLQPLPFARPDELVLLSERNLGAGITFSETAPATYAAWKSRVPSLADVALYDFATANLSGAGTPQRLRAFVGSANLFAVLGTRPALGRAFAPGEDRPGAPRVAVLSHAFWRDHLGGDAGVVGRTLRLDGEPVTVVGVMPAGFHFPAATDVWLPLRLDGEALLNHRDRWLRVVARVRPAVEPAAVRAELEAVARQLQAEHPDTHTGWSASLRPIRGGLLDGVDRQLQVVMAGALFVLLIACANVANLLLARATGRRREIAVRAALGAGRRRIVRQLLTESVLLGVAGGAGGVLLAVWAAESIRAALPRGVLDFIPALAEARVNGGVLAFALVLSLATGVVFGLAPALHAARADVQSALKEGGRGATAGRGRVRARGALVVAQVALALVLLAGAGLMIRTVGQLMGTEWGFRTRGLLTLRVSLPDAEYPTDTAAARFYDALLARLAAVPEVRAAGLTTGLPMSGEGGAVGLEIEGRPAPRPGTEPRAQYRGVSPGYLEALGVPLRAGRAFTARDRLGSPGAAIVSEAFARQHFPRGDALGRRVRVAGSDENPWREIVGIAANINDLRTSDRSQAYIYTPLLQLGQTQAFLAVRTAGEPAAVAASLRRAVAEIDPDLPVWDVATMEQRVGESFFPWRVVAWMLGALAGVALALAAVGVYAVVSYGVTQRTHEIGVRMALGAAGRDVLALVTRQGLVLALAGVALGLAGALAVTRLLSGLLYRVSPSDPAVFVSVASLLTLVALVASYLPARRAARVSPVVALRDEG